MGAGVAGAGGAFGKAFGISAAGAPGAATGGVTGVGIGGVGVSFGKAFGSSLGIGFGPIVGGVIGKEGGRNSLGASFGGCFD